MVYIEEALEGVRAGRKITEYSDLSDAISAARSGINSRAYATQFERTATRLCWRASSLTWQSRAMSS